MRIESVRFLFLSVFLIAGIGCSTVSLPTAFKPGPDAEPLSEEEARGVMAELSTVHDIPFNRIRTLLSTRLRTDQGIDQFRYAIVSESGGAFRLETLPLFGAYPLNSLIIREGQYYARDAGSGEVRSGRLSARVLRNIIGFEAAPEDLFYLLQGRLSPEWFTLTKRIYQLEGGSYLFDGGDRFRARIVSLSGFVESLIVFDGWNGEPQAQITYSGYREFMDGVFYPARIEIEVYDPSVSLTMDASLWKGEKAEGLKPFLLPWASPGQ